MAKITAVIFLQDMPPDGKEVDKGLNVPKKDF
jgi:hypothetical protein